MHEAAGGDYRRMADLEPCQSWMGHCALEWSRAGGDRKMLGAFYRPADDWEVPTDPRSEEHTSELQSLMRISYAVFCLKKKNKPHNRHNIKYKYSIAKTYMPRSYNEDTQ